MIGWENNQGAYFIQKLKDAVDNLSKVLEDTDDNIGSLSDLSTTAKNNIVSAINELELAISSLSIPDLPDSPSSNGSYVLKITSEGSEWDSYSAPTIPDVPDVPSANGTYVLVVADGVATWTTQQAQGED